MVKILFVLQFFNKFLHYSKSERRGIIVLVSLIFVTLLFNKLLPFLFPAEPLEITISDYSDSKLESDSSPTTHTLFAFNPNTITKDSLILLGLSAKAANNWINYRNKIGDFRSAKDVKKLYSLDAITYERIAPYFIFNNEKSSPSSKATPESKTPISYFQFDPNTADKSQLIELGIPQKAASTIINYRSKGGKFHKAEDLLKIYGFPKDVYRNLEPYIIIPTTEQNNEKETEKTTTKNEYKKEKAVNVTININTAAPEGWQKLNGIGPAYSKRIVKFRDALGGFYSTQQIAETYGLPDSVFQKIAPQLQIDPSFQCAKININTASIDELKAHPYIDRKKASILFNYRKNHGPFNNIDDVKKVKVMKEKDIQKLKAYLEY